MNVLSTLAQRIFWFGLLLTGFISPAHAQTKPKMPENSVFKPELKALFDDRKVSGSITVYDSKDDLWYFSDETDAFKGELPASTFKIPNLLIALETGVIQYTTETVRWNNRKLNPALYGERKSIERDMTVEEAFRESAGWVFCDLSERIGKSNYRKYLTAFRYGNGFLERNSPDFWNFSSRTEPDLKETVENAQPPIHKTHSFTVTPFEQVMLLKGLYTESLPVSKAHQKAVKRIMKSESGDGPQFYAKTGWTRDRGINLGWWVGFVEIETGQPVFFATRITQNREWKTDDFPAYRMEITKKALANLGLIK